MDPEKKQKMEAEGYEFDADLECFINRGAGKIFSSSWVDNQNMNTVHISLSLPHNPTVWKLHLAPEQPHEEMRVALFEKYGSTP